MERDGAATHLVQLPSPPTDLLDEGMVLHCQMEVLPETTITLEWAGTFRLTEVDWT